MSDSWIALKLEAQFAGRYLMPSVLITSTMKSDPGTPPMRDAAPFSPGLAVSAAATCALGGRAEGRRSGAAGGVAGNAGVTAPAAVVAMTPGRDFRRAVMGWSPGGGGEKKKKGGD